MARLWNGLEQRLVQTPFQLQKHCNLPDIEFVEIFHEPQISGKEESVGSHNYS